MSGEEWCWINFKYERLPIFCFYYGLLGHAERTCGKLFRRVAVVSEIGGYIMELIFLRRLSMKKGLKTTWVSQVSCWIMGWVSHGA